MNSIAGNVINPRRNWLMTINIAMLAVYGAQGYEEKMSIFSKKKIWAIVKTPKMNFNLKVTIQTFRVLHLLIELGIVPKVHEARFLNFKSFETYRQKKLLGRAAYQNGS